MQKARGECLKGSRAYVKQLWCFGVRSWVKWLQLYLSHWILVRRYRRISLWEICMGKRGLLIALSTLLWLPLCGAPESALVSRLSLAFATLPVTGLETPKLRVVHLGRSTCHPRVLRGSPRSCGGRKGSPRSMDESHPVIKELGSPGETLDPGASVESRPILPFTTRP